jgi:hypothetical protein
MNWRKYPPLRKDFDTEQEYEDAIDRYVDALEADYEYRKNREID